MKIAVVTGASSGLGREFVKQLGVKGTLDEIWAIARRKEHLEALRQLTTCPVRALSLDLTDRASFQMLTALLAQEQPDVRYLINAAGFGRMGQSMEIPLADSEGMIDLNCRAAVSMTALVRPYVSRGSCILEICSTAAFQPLPGLNVYAASKAFLMSYTKALHHELLLTGIHVTAVCPYWVRGTEFIGRAQETDRGGVRHFPLASRPASVVRWALIGSKCNLWVSCPSPVAVLQRLSTKLVPHCIVVPLWDLLRRL